MELNKLGVVGAVKGYSNGEFTAKKMVESCLSNAEKHASKNAVIEIFDDALLVAEKLDEKRANGEKLGKLAGAVVMIKDNILVKGKKATACSKFLKDFESIYTSTAVQKMLDEDAIILGRTNMDEFSMGGDSKSSIHGITKNAISDSRTAGGSSSGSAVAVALDMCSIALGTDAGGSIRIPAVYNGVCAIKPTLGLVSKHGVYAYATSFDAVGPIAKSVEDCAYLLEIIAGNDSFDMTSTTATNFDFTSKIEDYITGRVFGLEKNIIKEIENSKNYEKFKDLLGFIDAYGGTIKEIDIDGVTLLDDAYKLIAYAEASSNLARYDGLKYTTQTAEPKNAEELYVKSRTEGFGKEVKRRIMMGNYILSKAGTYQTAKNFQQYLINQFEDKMQGVDCLLMPMTLEEAPENNACSKTSIDAILGEFANVIKVPSVAIPYSVGKDDLPLGVQFIGKKNDEALLLNIANFVQKNYKGGQN